MKRNPTFETKDIASLGTTLRFHKPEKFEKWGDAFFVNVSKGDCECVSLSFTLSNKEARRLGRFLLARAGGKKRVL